MFSTALGGREGKTAASSKPLNKISWKRSEQDRGVSPEPSPSSKFSRLASEAAGLTDTRTDTTLGALKPPGCWGRVPLPTGRALRPPGTAPRAPLGESPGAGREP